MGRRILKMVLPLIIVLRWAGWALAQQEFYVPGEILVHFQEPLPEITMRDNQISTGIQSFDLLCNSNNIRSIHPILRSHPEFRGRYRLTFPKTANVHQLCESLKQIECMNFVSLNHVAFPFTDNPSDPEFGNQWALGKIEAKKAWDITTGGNDVTVSVVGFGVNIDHEDLHQKIWTNSGEIPGNGIDDDGNGHIDDIHGWNFRGPDSTDVHEKDFGTFKSHDTGVAGIIGALTNNDIGMAGLAGGWWPNNISPKIMPVKALLFSDYYGVPDDAAADAILYAADMGAKVINLSWGGWDPLPEVEDAIDYAVNDKGCLVVVSAGQPINPDDPPGPMVMQLPYPARYNWVIAVGSTDLNDVKQETGYFDEAGKLDMSAPGVDIKSATAPNNDQYWYHSGTSFSAPHVAALSALIFSINPDLSPIEVEDIIKQTADKVRPDLYTYNSNGRCDELGYGRINAYQALLLALAYDTKPHSSLATAYNNGRRLIRDGNNRYHLLFESGGEIFYCRSNVGGSSWETPVRLSTGNESNKYPSITGTSSKQFIVWQRYNQETSNYDTYFTKNTGSGWTSAVTITNLSNLTSTTDPLPVVSYKTRSGGYRLLVGAKNSSAIRYVTSDNDGSAWSSAGNLPSTGSSHKNPSLSMGPTTPSSTVYVAYDNGSNIYYNTYTTSWGSAHNVSSGCGTSSNRYPSVEVDGWSGRNFAWQGFSNPLLCWVIVHRRNNGAFQIFSNKGDGGNRASITGHVNNKRSIVFTADGANEIYRAKYNGSNWSVDLKASNGQHPNISAGTTTAKYVWTSGSSSPYEIKLSSEYLSKSSGEMNLVYHRAAVLQDTLNSFLLWTELGEILLKTESGEILVLLKPVENRDLELTQNSVFTYLESEPFVIPADVTGIICYRNVYGKGLQQVSAKGVESVSIKLQLVDVQTGKTLQQLQEESLAVAEQESRVQGTVTKEITGYYGKKVVIRVVAEGLAAEVTGVVPGVVEVFITDQEGTAKQQPQRPKREVVQTPAEFALLQSYPNPFNPETSIPYALPQESHVIIEVYNVLGQQIATLADEYKSAGYHTAYWDGRDASGKKAPAGIYLCRMRAGDFVKTQKMTLLP